VNQWIARGHGRFNRSSSPGGAKRRNGSDFVPRREGQHSTGWIPAVRVPDDACVGSRPLRFDSDRDDERFGNSPDLTVIVAQPFDGRSGLSTWLEAREAGRRRWEHGLAIRLVPAAVWDRVLTRLAEHIYQSPSIVVDDVPALELSENELVAAFQQSLAGRSWRDVGVHGRRLDLIAIPRSASLQHLTN